LRSKIALSFSVALGLLLSACSTPRGGGIGPGYFVQAALGQLQISSRARPILDVLHDGRINLRTQKALESVGRIKAFGEGQGLRATKSYEQYTDLHRPAVVWVVSACEPLQFEVQRWSFPIVGSFSYLGWFDRSAGEGFRDRLAAQGYDADIRPARAYSTLGWFRDPLLSTMIPEEKDFGDLVEVILHESVHVTLHLDGQSTLNESLAQFLGEKLAARFLEQEGGGVVLMSYRDSLKQEKARTARLRAGYRELDELYRSARADSEKQAEKQRILARLRHELKWPESRALNNATLVQFSTYESSPEAFEALWQACGQSASRMLGAVRAWSESDERVRSGRELQGDELESALSTMRTRCR
jgi:predicted aminopeptidase